MRDVRLIDVSSNQISSLDGIKSINFLRKQIIKSNNSVRLVGLSGVGKTRLVQALFEPDIGDVSLSKEHLFYTDSSFSPNPLPSVLAEALVKKKKEAIIIVDNCPPDEHRRLTKSVALKVVKQSF